LQIDDRTGLFIEPCFTRTDNTAQHQDPISDNIAHASQGDETMLSQEETAFFEKAEGHEEINIDTH